MKIILSRKGFDSSSGGYPSPILPDGTMLSLPIPDGDSKISYNTLQSKKNHSYYDFMSNLKGKVKVNNKWMELDQNTCCHLDPDLQKDTIQREKHWRGLFGQSGAAQRHLENQNVSEGDLFLFFGWFRNTKYQGDRLVFDSNDPLGRHIIYGYLQVGEIRRLDPSVSIPDWMNGHPHVTEQKRKKDGNTIYIAKDNLSWNEQASGYGTFDYREQFVLTKKGMKKSCWELPDFFKDQHISYHKPSSWKVDYFQSVARGQEFVVHANERIIQWAQNLIDS